MLCVRVCVWGGALWTIDCCMKGIQCRGGTESTCPVGWVGPPAPPFKHSRVTARCLCCPHPAPPHPTHTPPPSHAPSPPGPSHHRNGVPGVRSRGGVHDGGGAQGPHLPLGGCAAATGTEGVGVYMGKRTRLGGVPVRLAPPPRSCPRIHTCLKFLQGAHAPPFPFILEDVRPVADQQHKVIGAWGGRDGCTYPHLFTLPNSFHLCSHLLHSYV